MINTYKLLLKSTPFKKRKDINVFVGMSGGVDSSTTAYLLKQDGFNVKGVYIKCFDDGTPNCRSKQDRNDAVKVASQLDIPFETWDFEKEYKQKVIDYFVSGYKKGLTPNPDILCNSEIKFKLFLDKCLQKGADYVATGHYARIVDYGLQIKDLRLGNNTIEESGEAESQKLTAESLKQNTQNTQNTNLLSIIHTPLSFYLAIPKDKSKDQTYFLSSIGANKFCKILFPLGDFKKTEVREVAKIAKISVADKKDSTGICFLEGINMQEFLRKNIQEKKGDVVYKNKKIGVHKGVWFYTIGQRHGFDVNKYVGKPLYVIKKDSENNILFVGEKKELLNSTVTVNKLDIANYNLHIKNSEHLYLRIRNLGKLRLIKSIINVDAVSIIKLAKKIDSIAPGQFAVIYKKVGGDYLLVGSGVIKG